MSTKFSNEKTIADGIKFDSKKEEQRYYYLKLLEKAGEIKSFEHHKKYVLLESFENSDGKHRSPITYTPDFVITNNNETLYAEDVKGSRDIITPLFIVKQKLFECRYPEIPLKLIAFINKRWVNITYKEKVNHE